MDFFFIFITRVDIADDIINASDSNRDHSEPVAGSNLDNEVMQQDFVFEDQENNQVRNVENLCLTCARSITLIVSCVSLIPRVRYSSVFLLIYL
jgi:hypothetical protein